MRGSDFKAAIKVLKHVDSLDLGFDEIVIEDGEVVEDMYAETAYFYDTTARTEYIGPCTRCNTYNGVFSLPKNPIYSRIVQDLKIDDQTVYLNINYYRCRCPQCGANFSYPYKEIVPRKDLTVRLYEFLMAESLSKPFYQLAKEYHISTSVIGDYFHDYSDVLEAARGPILTPRVLGLNEYKVKGKQRAIMTDVEGGSLLEMGMDAAKATFRKLLHSMVAEASNQVTVIPLGASSLRDIAKKELPDTLIAIDPNKVFASFLVSIAGDTNRLLEHLRKLTSALPEGNEKAKKAKVLEKALGHERMFTALNMYNLSIAEEETLLELRKQFAEVADLMHAKEILQTLPVAEDEKEAQEVLDEWAKWAINLDDTIMPGTCRCNELIYDWKSEILAFFHGNVQPAAVSAELLLDKINQAGHGYAFNDLRLKTLYNDTAKLPKVTVYSERARISLAEEEPPSGYMCCTAADFDSVMEWFSTREKNTYNDKTMFESGIASFVPQGADIEKLLKQIEESPFL